MLVMECYCFSLESCCPMTHLETIDTHKSVKLIDPSLITYLFFIFRRTGGHCFQYFLDHGLFKFLFFCPKHCWFTTKINGRKLYHKKFMVMVEVAVLDPRWDVFFYKVTGSNDEKISGCFVLDQPQTKRNLYNNSYLSERELEWSLTGFWFLLPFDTFLTFLVSLRDIYIFVW